MRTVLRHTNEVCHYWANQIQPEGRAGNVYFDGPRIYSYGRHFCMARIDAAREKLRYFRLFNRFP